MNQLVWLLIINLIYLSTSHAILPHLEPGEVIWGCKTLGREVHLTYDDGPSSKTNELLDVLKEHKVNATFFVVGSNAQRFPETIQRMHREGHIVTSHTWSEIVRIYVNLLGLMPI